VIAIGGVTVERVEALVDAGAWGVAVSSAVAADSPRESARAFVDRMQFKQGDI
jgi:thiamine-phosphate pyrophosphorylase